MSSPWTSHDGIKMPVFPDAVVKVSRRDRSTATDKAQAFEWRHRGEDDDIFAHRVVTP